MITMTRLGADQTSPWTVCGLVVGSQERARLAVRIATEIRKQVAALLNATPTDTIVDIFVPSATMTAMLHRAMNETLYKGMRADSRAKTAIRMMLPHRYERGKSGRMVLLER